MIKKTDAKVKVRVGSYAIYKIYKEVKILKKVSKNWLNMRKLKKNTTRQLLPKDF